uniref:Uncharacterized protein n=1 Tax=Anguilla anguilla TaxID=7936 RepID=A0A0E9T2U2_ANGAN
MSSFCLKTRLGVFICKHLWLLLKIYVSLTVLK